MILGVTMIATCEAFALADKLGLDRPLIVGHSLGGAIAVCLARDFPQKTRGLALLAPLTRGGDAPSPAFASLGIKSDMMRKALAWTLATPLGMRNVDMVFNLVFGPDPVPRDYSTRGGGLLGLRPGSFFNTSRDFVSSMADIKWMRASYGDLQVPMAVLYGEDDRILSVDGYAVRGFSDFQRLVSTSPERPVTIAICRDGSSSSSES